MFSNTPNIFGAAGDSGSVESNVSQGIQQVCGVFAVLPTILATKITVGKFLSLATEDTLEEDESVAYQKHSQPWTMGTSHGDTEGESEGFGQQRYNAKRMIATKNSNQSSKPTHQDTHPKEKETPNHKRPPPFSPPLAPRNPIPLHNRTDTTKCNPHNNRVITSQLQSHGTTRANQSGIAQTAG